MNKKKTPAKAEPIYLTQEDVDKIKQTPTEHMMGEKGAIFDSINNLCGDVEEFAGAINANHSRNAKDIKEHVTKCTNDLAEHMNKQERDIKEHFTKEIKKLNHDRAEDFRAILRSNTSDEVRRMKESKDLRKFIEHTVKAVMCAMAVMNILAIAYIILR